MQRYDGEAEEAATLHEQLAKSALDEYATGEIAVTDGVVIGDSWKSGAKLSAKSPPKPGKVTGVGFFVPLPAGTYVVLEGRDDNNVWYRVRQGRAADFKPRPAAPVADPNAKEVAGILGRLKFGNDREEARALEAARELVTLGRADAALEVCDRVGPARKTLADWVRVFALAALGRDALTPLRALASEWLAPATAPDSVNQVLLRTNLLEAIDAAGAAGADVVHLRAEIVAAPQPEVFTAAGDDFF